MEIKISQKGSDGESKVCPLKRYAIYPVHQHRSIDPLLWALVFIQDGGAVFRRGQFYQAFHVENCPRAVVR